ncbi:MAG: hypothetical protein K0R47_3475 [Brevibacillus sp.]|nr:hypothetical protein [Brevibacillus sp.]
MRSLLAGIFAFFILVINLFPGAVLAASIQVPQLQAPNYQIPDIQTPQWESRLLMHRYPS